MYPKMDHPTVHKESIWTTIGETKAKPIILGRSSDIETIECEDIESTRPYYGPDTEEDGNVWTDMAELAAFLFRIILQGIAWLLVGLLAGLACLFHGLGNLVRRNIDGGSIRPLIRRPRNSHPPRRNKKRGRTEEIIIQQQIKIKR